MEKLLTLIYVTALAGIGGTGLGGVIGALFKKDSDRTASLLLSFAAGVMVAIVCFDLIVSAIDTKTNNTVETTLTKFDDSTEEDTYEYLFKQENGNYYLAEITKVK